MTPIEELNKISHLLPIQALQDIDKRMGDWLASGGKDDDPYMYQQLRYAENIVAALNSNGRVR